MTDTDLAGAGGIAKVEAVALMTKKANGVTASLTASADELKQFDVGDRKASNISITANDTYNDAGADKVADLNTLGRYSWFCQCIS